MAGQISYRQGRVRWWSGGKLSPPGQLVAAVTTGLEFVLFGLGVLVDFRECDHYASGSVLDGSGDKGPASAAAALAAA